MATADSTERNDGTQRKCRLFRILSVTVPMIRKTRCDSSRRIVATCLSLSTMMTVERDESWNVMYDKVIEEKYLFLKNWSSKNIPEFYQIFQQWLFPHHNDYHGFNRIMKRSPSVKSFWNTFDSFLQKNFSNSWKIPRWTEWDKRIDWMEFGEVKKKRSPMLSKMKDGMVHKLCKRSIKKKFIIEDILNPTSAVQDRSGRTLSTKKD